MSTPDERSVRADVRAWLTAHWDPDSRLVDWRNRLADSGWGVPHWPTAWYGRGLPVAMNAAIEAEFDAAGAVGVARIGIRMLAAATLLEHGSDAHKARFLRRILTGEDTWCQLFSEPGSGSDLAGATTRADFDGTQWRVNGQKLWTTSAHHAQWGLLLARTDWNAPKHQGLSYFVIDMTQPGIAVEPLRQMNGYASFNQVFFTDALIPAENLVGRIGDGWKIAMTTLAHERRNADALRRWGQASTRPGPGRIYDEERAEIATVMEPYKWYPQRAGRVDIVMPRARETGRIADPVLRQDLARLLMLSAAAEWLAHRARTAQEQGRPEGPGGSLGKLAASHVARAAAAVHTAISGADALLAGVDGPHDGLIAEILLSVPATSIAGGTDEIQRNIIAERVLGLPREPRLDGGPFRDVPRNPER
jgi:alkylation response protein AidB-like acyl-CoA dehydrogenase